MGINTNYKVPDGAGGFYDIGLNLVEKSYLIDRYPELADTFRFAGLWGWGNNGAGALGDNTVATKLSPVQTVAGGANWKLVSAGGGGGGGAGNIAHTAAIKTDGTLWTWGYNATGQLGDNTTTGKLSPVQTISGGTNWKLVSAGLYYTAAIKTDGTLWLWGQNTAGWLGTNNRINYSSPVQTIAAGTNWKHVAAGWYHTAAIKTDGTLWNWGEGTNGQLGDNSAIKKSSPIQTIAGGTNWKQVACGFVHTVAIKTDGTLWTWGYNLYGQLGDNTAVNKSSPVQTIAAGTNWKLVSAGYYHTAAIKTDGTLWAWGQGTNGQLGDNTAVNKSSPVQTISGGTNWKQVAVGANYTAAIKTDGTLWAWGQGTNGQLGNNTNTNKSSPVQTIAAGTNWKLVSCGQQHTAAIRDDSEDLL